MHDPHKLHSSLTRFFIIFCLAVVIFLPRPVLGWVFLQRAPMLENAGKFQQASFAYEEASYRCWWEDGLLEKAAFDALKAGDDQGAVRLFTNSLASGLSDQGRMALGELQAKGGMPAQALETWRSISPASQYKAASYFNGADLELGLGAYEQAVFLYQQGLKLEPANVLARYNLGMILTAIDPYQAFQQLIQVTGLSVDQMEDVSKLTTGLDETLLSSDSARQLISSGKLLASIQEWKLAFLAFQNSIQINNHYAEAWAWQGESAYQVGEDPLPYLQKSLTVDKYSVPALAFNGLYFRRIDQLDQAFNYYQKAAQLDHENASWQIILGEISAERGDLASALEYYQAATAISPDDVQTWRAMLDLSIHYQLYVDNVGLNAAVQIFKLDPDGWESYDDMGQVMLWSKKVGFAEFYFTKSIRIDPHQPTSHFHLGLVYLLQDRDDEAVSQFQKTVDLAPDSPAGIQAAQLLDQNSP